MTDADRGRRIQHLIVRAWEALQSPAPRAAPSTRYGVVRALLDTIASPEDSPEWRRAVRLHDEAHEHVNALVVGYLKRTHLSCCAQMAARKHGLPVEDLYQEGAIGVMRAAWRWDPDGGCAQFASFAPGWVRAAMQRAVEEARLIHAPNWLADLRAQIDALRTAAALRGQSLSPHAAGRILGRSPADVDAALRTAAAEPLAETPAEEREFGGVRLACHRPSPEALLAARERWPAVQAALASLPGPRAVVLQRHAEGDTLSEVAADLGVSRQRVQQLQADGLRRLRAMLA